MKKIPQRLFNAEQFVMGEIKILDKAMRDLYECDKLGGMMRVRSDLRRRRAQLRCIKSKIIKIQKEG